MDMKSGIGGRDHWVRSAKRGSRVLRTMFVWWLHGIGAQLIALGLLATFGLFFWVPTELGLPAIVGFISGLLGIPLVLTAYGSIVLEPEEKDDPRALGDEEMRPIEEKEER